MAAYTSKADGDFNADGQTTWNEAGHPDGADDTATITHAITASAGITCGAITINAGGSLDTGTAAATITSITTASTGACTIGSGGCTFAGVLNNAGSGTLTINGACTGVTTLTTGTATAAANVTCTTGVVIHSGKTFTFNSGTLATPEFPTSAAGTLTMAAGTTLNFSTAGFPNIGTVNLNGTAESQITVTNTTGGTTKTILYSASFNITYANITKCSLIPRGDCVIDNTAISSGVTATGAVGPDSNGYGFTYRLNRVWLYGSRFGLGVQNIRVIGRNVCFGYDRGGNASANATVGDIVSEAVGTSDVRLDNVVLGSTVSVFHGGAYSIQANNVGLLDDDMFPASTARGVGVRWTDKGKSERSTTNPPSGKTYHARLTPTATCSAAKPLEFAVYMPVLTGDNISVTAKASRSTTDITAACADCVIDPEGAWFTPTTVAWDLTNAATYYALPTCEATNASGSSAKGTVRVVFRLKEYSAADFLDIGDITITCGGTAYAVSCQNWANGMPVPDEPAASGGGGTYPDADYVHADAGDYGPTGTEYTPALSALSNWCLIAGIVWPPLDEVDGGRTFGPITGTEYTGTGVNATTIRTALGLAAANLDAQLGDIPTLAELTALVQGITQAQRVRVLPAPMMERPDSESTPYRIWIYAYDAEHKAEDLDSVPTVSVENHAGVDRSANLGTVTKPGGTTGQYYVDYTVASDHAIEGLVVKVDATEGGVSTGYAAPSIVVDTTAVDFTAADRTKLETLATDYSTARAAALDNLDAAVSTRLPTTGYTAPDNATIGAISSAVNTHRTDTEVVLGKLSDMIQLDEASSPQFTANALEQSPTAAGAFTDEDRAALAAAKAVTDAIATMIVIDGAVYQFTENALELGPAGSGVSFGSIAFALQSTVGAGQVADGSITLYQNAAIAGIVIVVTDEEGDAIDLSAATLVLVVYKDPATVLWSLTEAAGQLTVGGASNNQVTLAANGSYTATPGHYRYALWDTAADLVRARGVLTIEREASAPQG